MEILSTSFTALEGFHRRGVGDAALMTMLNKGCRSNLYTSSWDNVQYI